MSTSRICRPGIVDVLCCSKRRCGLEENHVINGAKAFLRPRECVTNNLTHGCLVSRKVGWPLECVKVYGFCELENSRIVGSHHSPRQTLGALCRVKCVLHERSSAKILQIFPWDALRARACGHYPERATVNG